MNLSLLPPPAMQGEWGSLAFIRQLVKKVNSEFKPAVFYLKFNLCYIQVEWLGKYILKLLCNPENSIYRQPNLQRLLTDFLDE